MSAFADLLLTRFGIPVEAEDPPAGAEALAAMLARRSYRKYAETPVADDLRRLLLACAQSASAKSDLQQYSIIDVTDADLKTRLSEISATPFLAGAPIALVFCGDLRRTRRIVEMRGYDYAQDTLASFMNAVVDAALAMQGFILAAEAAGLGCCPISQVRKDIEATGELLALPPGVFPVAGLTAGWPAEERDVTLRLPPSVVVHENRYDDSSLEAEIAGYDQRRHAVRPTPPDRQFDPERFGAAEFYGWSENAARRMATPETAVSLFEFLKGHGFGLE